MVQTTWRRRATPPTPCCCCCCGLDDSIQRASARTGVVALSPLGRWCSPVDGRVATTMICIAFCTPTPRRVRGLHFDYGEQLHVAERAPDIRTFHGPIPAATSDTLTWLARDTRARPAESGRRFGARRTGVPPRALGELVAHAPVPRHRDAPSDEWPREIRLTARASSRRSLLR